MLEKETKLIIEELKTSTFLQQVVHTEVKRYAKSAENSNRARLEGNKIYKKETHTKLEHEQILTYYAKSIATAPWDSEELAKAYGNRSALLLHLLEYKECLKDVNRALNITYSMPLKEKLNQRKQRCEEALYMKEGEDFTFQIKDNWRQDVKNLLKSTEVDDEANYLRPFSKLSLLSSPSDDVGTDREIMLRRLHEAEEKKDKPDFVKIKHTPKYGRHLVASKDIAPGQILLIEKPYVACLNIKKPYLYCCNCLKFSWSGIPCPGCGWFLFCSDKCLLAAVKEYHDIECKVVPYVAHFLNHLNNELGETERVCYDGLSIRAVIKGLREYGGLQELKAEVEKMEACKSKLIKGFSSEGKFESNTFKALFSLTYDIPSDEMKSHIRFAAITLLCMAKYSSFFGKEFELAHLDKLTRNPDFIFVGALILRLSMISNVNGHNIGNVTDDCKYGNDAFDCKRSMCCTKGNSIAPLVSLTNHSCNPNVRRCFTDDLKVVVYALKPISKGSQIFDCYCYTFYDLENPDRREFLQSNFNFECSCLACENEWPTWPVNDVIVEEMSGIFKDMSVKELHFYKGFKKLIQSVEQDNCYYDEDIIARLKSAIEIAFKSLGQPSVITHKLMFCLVLVFEKIYAYRLQMFDNCGF